MSSPEANLHLRQVKMFSGARAKKTALFDRLPQKNTAIRLIGWQAGGLHPDFPPALAFDQTNPCRNSGLEKAHCDTGIGAWPPKRARNSGAISTASPANGMAGR
jgi:hypothetical protein